MHADTACDLVGQNQYKKSLGRSVTRQRLQSEGTGVVPSQRTAFCPQIVTPLTSGESQQGFDTSWIIENTATVPVVVAYMLERSDGSFVEVSAFDNMISPPHHDPKAILKPGEWKSVMAYEGHVFHVREILKDGSAGMILLQHRIGMVDITNKYGHDLDCAPSEPDIEPVVVKPEGVMERDPDYARLLAPELRLCNVLDVGFRNKVGCPVNGYYTGHYLLKGLARPRGNVTEWKQELARTPKSCHERFEFHLGLNPHPKDFMWNWTSTTKYESTYIGQSFVFRLAKDERVVVDSVTMQTTKVIDCPGLKNQINAVSLPYAQAIIDPIASWQNYHLRHLVKGLNETMAGAANASEWILPTFTLPMVASGVWSDA